MKSFARGMHHMSAPQEIIIVKLLTAVGIATLVTITSLFLYELGMSSSLIGLVSSTAYIASFAVGLLLPRLLMRHNIEKLLVVGILALSLILALLGLVNSALLVVTLFLLARTTVVLIDNTASILFKDDSGSRSSFFKNQALSGSLVNLAWVIAPLMAGLLIEYRSFTFTYLTSSFIVLLGALYLLFNPVPVQKKSHKKINHSILSNVSFYLSKKHLRDAYFMSFGTNVWWGFLFTFVTIFMMDHGYSATSIGLFIAITQVPLFLFEFRSHLLIERFKFRLPFILSYGLLSLSSAVVFVLPFGVISLVSLAIGSLAIILIEPSSELFIYERLNAQEEEEEERVYPLYSTARILGSILIRLMASLVIAVFTFKATFLAVALVMAFLAYRAYKIEPKY